MEATCEFGPQQVVNQLVAPHGRQTGEAFGHYVQREMGFIDMALGRRFASPSMTGVLRAIVRHFADRRIQFTS